MAVPPEHENTLDELLDGPDQGIKQLSTGFWSKDGNRGFRRGRRINTCHHAAFCRACEAAGVVFDEQKGTCGGYPMAVQTHLASCKNVARTERETAAGKIVELKAAKGKKRAADLPEEQPSKKHCSSSSQSSKLHTVPLKDTPLSPEDERRADQLLVEVTVSANFALQWVDNPKVRELFDLIRPEFKLPSRKTLHVPRLQTAVKIVEAAKEAALAQSEGASCQLAHRPV